MKLKYNLNVHTFNVEHKTAKRHEIIRYAVNILKEYKIDNLRLKKINKNEFKVCNKNNTKITNI